MNGKVLYSVDGVVACVGAYKTFYTQSICSRIDGLRNRRAVGIVIAYLGRIGLDIVSRQYSRKRISCPCGRVVAGILEVDAIAVVVDIRRLEIDSEGLGRDHILE